MEEDEVYLWRNKYDKELWHLGIKIPNKRGYLSCANLTLDKMSLIFGDDIIKKISRLPMRPVEVKLKIEIER